MLIRALGRNKLLSLVSFGTIVLAIVLTLINELLLLVSLSRLKLLMALLLNYEIFVVSAKALIGIFCVVRSRIAWLPSSRIFSNSLNSLRLGQIALRGVLLLVALGVVVVTQRLEFDCVSNKGNLA